MKTKWIGIIMSLLAATAGAETTNTWTGATDTYLGEAGNWDTAPTVTDWSANMVFGAAPSYTIQNKGAGGANVTIQAVSLNYTADAVGTYIMAGGTVRLTEGIINDSVNHLRIAPATLDLCWSATHPEIHVRANSSNIRFETYIGGIRILTGNVHFHAVKGRSITIYDNDPDSKLVALSADRLLNFHGDGAGGELIMLGGVDTSSYQMNLAVLDAGIATLSMNSGQFQDITLQDGTLVYSKDNMSFGGLALNAGDNTVEFNGNDNAFGELTIAAGADNVFDMGTGTNAITFADSSTNEWLSGLVITNFEAGVDSIRFGTDANGLAGSQLALITVDGFINGVSLDSQGYLVDFSDDGDPGVFTISSIGLDEEVATVGLSSTNQAEIAFVLEHTTDLVSSNWLPVATNLLQDPGGTFVHTNQSARPIGFYRVTTEVSQ